MDRKMILAVADDIEQYPQMLNMQIYGGHPIERDGGCGTPGCVYDFAYIRAASDKRIDPEQHLAEIFDISEGKASYIFHGGFSNKPMSRLHEITAAETVAYLRELAASEDG